MQYDSLNYNSYEDEITFYTIQMLIDLCNKYPEHTFKFFDTDYTVSDLHSWRGSYDLPAISYESGNELGKVIAERLKEQLQKEHWGYKGGKYKFFSHEEFYVSVQGSAQEFKLVGFEVDRYNENTIILLTKISKY